MPESRYIRTDALCHQCHGVRFNVLIMCVAATNSTVVISVFVADLVSHCAVVFDLNFVLIRMVYGDTGSVSA